MVRLGRRQAENFAKAVEVVERTLGPLGEIEVLSHLDVVEGLFDIDSQKIWVSSKALVTLELAVEAVLQGAIEKLSGSAPLSQDFELYMRRTLARVILEKEGLRSDGLEEV